MDRRIVWIHPVSSILGKILFGPEIRLLRMAEILSRSGFDVRIVLSECERPLPQGVTIWHERNGLPPATGEDIVLVNPFLPLRKLWPILRGPGFVVSDFYSVHLPEFLQEEHLHPPRVFRIQLRRIWLRYAWLARRANTCVFSNPQQLAFVSGGLALQPGLDDVRLANTLAGKSIFCPMGVDLRENVTGHPNPFPDALKNRPIFLWGGGIWPWMDLDPLLEAFAKSKVRGSSACLFFLSGAPADPSSRLAQPVEKVRRKASQLEILDTHVFLNPRPVPFDARLGYLEHCTAGVLCNPPTLESACSWRTRMLDLLLAGRTAVVAGYDPLSADLARLDAIEQVPLDPEEIAQAIERVCSPTRRAELESHMAAASQSQEWDQTLASLVETLRSRPFAATANPGPHLRELIRFVRPF